MNNNYRRRTAHALNTETLATLKRVARAIGARITQPETEDKKAHMTKAEVIVSIMDRYDVVSNILREDWYQLIEEDNAHLIWIPITTFIPEIETVISIKKYLKDHLVPIGRNNKAELIKKVKDHQASVADQAPPTKTISDYIDTRTDKVQIQEESAKRRARYLRRAIKDEKMDKAKEDSDAGTPWEEGRLTKEIEDDYIKHGVLLEKTERKKRVGKGKGVKEEERKKRVDKGKGVKEEERVEEEGEEPVPERTRSEFDTQRDADKVLLYQTHHGGPKDGQPITKEEREAKATRNTRHRMEDTSRPFLSESEGKALAMRIKQEKMRNHSEIKIKEAYMEDAENTPAKKDESEEMKQQKTHMPLSINNTPFVFKATKQLSLLEMYTRDITIEALPQIAKLAMEYAIKIKLLYDATREDGKSASIEELANRAKKSVQGEEEEYVVDVNMSASAVVRSWKRDGATGGFTDPDWNFAKTPYLRISNKPFKPIPNIEDVIHEWLEDTTERLQNLCETSDLYVNIESINIVTFTFHLTRMAGAGDVHLSRPSDFIEIFNPDVNEDCFFRCMEEAGVTPITTLSELKGGKQERGPRGKPIIIHPKIGIAVKTRDIADILKQMEPQTQVVLHRIKPQSVAFMTETTLHPRNSFKTNGAKRVHLGIIGSHYFLAKDDKVFTRVTGADFYSDEKNTEAPIDTDVPIKAKPLVKGSGGSLWAERSIERRELIDRDTIPEEIKRNFKTVNGTLTPTGIKRMEKYIEIENGKTHRQRELTNDPQRHMENTYFWDLETMLIPSEEYIATKKIRALQILESSRMGVAPPPLSIVDKRILANKGSHTVYNFGIVKGLRREENETNEAYGERLYEASIVQYYSEEKGEVIDRAVNLILNMKTTAASKVQTELTKWANVNRETTAAEKTAKFKQLKKDYKITLYAHNASRFDHAFLFKHPALSFKSVVDANGFISLTLVGGIVEFRDTIRMIPDSLDRICTSFKLPKAYSKTSFPHTFAKKKNMFYTGPIPGPKYWGGVGVPLHKREVPKQYQEKLANGRYVIKDEPFDFMTTSIHYQRLDVVSLAMAWNLYGIAMQEVTGLNIKDFMTLPSLSYHYVLEGTKPNQVYVVKDRAIDTWIRKAIQGGRTFVQKGKFTSKQYQLVKDALARIDEMPIPEADKEERTRVRVEQQRILTEAYNKVDDYLMDSDAVSLYPSAMTIYPYPTGEPKWLETDEELEELRLTLNRGKPARDEDAAKLSIVECDITFTDPDIVCPLIATKGPTPNNKKAQRLVYSLNDATIIKTNIDIQEAVTFNKAVVTKVHKALVWPTKDHIFRDSITKLFETRKQAKRDGNGAMDISCKTAMNASYGRTFMRLMDENTEILSVNSDSKLNEIYSSGRVKNVSILANESQILVVSDSKKLKTPKDPVHLGAFILAYSKVIANEFADAFDAFTSWEKTFYYTDTDSYHLHVDSDREAQRRNPAIYGTDMGQFHNDLDLRDGKVIYSIFVNPKFYIDVVIGYRGSKMVVSNHIRSKGIGRGVARTLTPEDYDTFYRGESKHMEFERLSRDFKDTLAAPISTVNTTKLLNGAKFDGRIDSRSIDDDTERVWEKTNGTNRWIPFHPSREIPLWST